MKNIQENQKLVASGLVGLGLYSAGVMGYGPTIGLSQTLTFSATWLVQQLIGSFCIYCCTNSSWHDVGWCYCCNCNCIYCMVYF